MNTQKNSMQSNGGKARAANLTANQLKAIASKGALARWGAKATHRGNFKAEFGTDVECYVLNDAMKTPVISQRGMGEAIGLSIRGNAFPRFMEGQAMTEAVGAQLRRKLSQPIHFQLITGGAQHRTLTIHGYDATLLIDVCHAIIAAEPNLTPQQKHVAKQAHIILGASAKAGIRGLVYALAGYSPAINEVISAFKAYVQEEAKKYESEFAPELYAEWHRLYQIPVSAQGRSWHFKHLTLKHIYFPLAKSQGKILELLKAAKANNGDRQKRLFQFLNVVGAKKLRFNMGQIFEMAVTSATKEEYEAKILQRFGGQQELDVAAPDLLPESAPMETEPKVEEIKVEAATS